jgi:DNA adenine methylase
MKTQTCKPILRWPGGKTRMIKKLLPKIPPHVCYCEPFAGGLAVLFAKERSPVEVINDINGDLVALYLNAQRHLPELMRQIESAISSRQMFHLYGKNPGLTEIERAARYLLRNRNSFSGNCKSFAVAKTRGGNASLDREKLNALLAAAHERLNRVTIENIPYERCFANYDARESFFFLDPPYLDAQPGAYAGWDRAQLKTFRRQVDKIKGQWVITLDDSPFNRDLFRDCPIEPVVTSNKMINSNTVAGAKFGELIITKP